MSKWIKARSLWCSDRDDISESLINEIDELVRFKSFAKKREVRELIDNALCDCSMYRDTENTSESKLIYRLLFILFVPMQIILLPYCAIKWLFGRGWYLDNQSRISNIIRKIDKYS